LAGWYTTEGAILSLGAEWIEEERAYNFSIYSERAERVTLPPRHESDAVIYEMHVRGFTQSPTSGLAPGRMGTYAGVKEARMNVPGSPLGNWRWRCTDGMLSASDFQWLRDLTETSNRSFPHQSPCLSEATP